MAGKKEAKCLLLVIFHWLILFHNARPLISHFSFSNYDWCSEEVKRGYVKIIDAAVSWERASIDKVH